MRLLSTRARTYVLLAALGLWVIVATVFCDLTRVPMADESWCLLVANQLVHGGVLYRDMFCGVTPLSFQLLAAVVAVAGSQILLVRALNCLLVAAAACLCAYQARRSGASDRVIGLLVLAIPLFADPQPDSLYSTLGTVFYLASAVPVNPFLAGAFAGLAFASKQTVGIYAMAALLAGWAFERRLFRRRMLSACAAFAGVAALFLIPIAWSGAWPRFIEYTVLNKGVYLNTAGMNYLTESQLNPQAYQLLFQQLWYGGDRLGAAAMWVRTWRFLLPLGLIPLGWRLLKERDARRAPVWFFGLFALLLFYPRADASHLRFAAPSLLVALAAIPKRPPRAWLAAGLALVFLGAAGALYLRPAHQWRKGWLAPAGIPHFRGVLWTPEAGEIWRSQLAALREANRRYGPMFLQTGEAPSLYLAGDIPPATPFEYPAASAFGPTGQAEVIGALESGRLRSVCFNDNVGDSLRPEQIAGYIETRMMPGPDLGVCRVYLPVR